MFFLQGIFGCLAGIAYFCDHIYVYITLILTKITIIMDKRLLTAAMLTAFAILTRAVPIRIVTTPEDGCFTITGSETLDKCVILYDPDDEEVVSTALACLVSDVKAVSKKTLIQYKAMPEGRNPIIAGTIGSNKYIDAMIESGKIDVGDVKDKWESYGIEVVDDPMEGVEKALVIYGSQGRATAYGIFELSRMMGVSPWIWWADVTPATKSTLYATRGKTIVGSPSVKFRGIFLNDEDYGLRPWAARKMDTSLKNFGPVTYGKIMELLLRLRANTLWPAMHAGSRAFWFEKTNIPLISKYDIYMGSSHCEQMLRDNVYEWSKYGGKGEEDWNWLTNRDMVKRYWADRVGESRGKNAIYTLGMRGLHDSGMNGYSTAAARKEALTEVLGYQRQLITDSLGDPTGIPQVFIPYKEVLDVYNLGLKVPDDVTLMWVDDNHGYVRQLPSPDEQARPGGNAVYYHLSYWGTPASYLWLSTISPTLCSYELSKAYDQGVRNQWIINVGDIKPAEEELEFCMDLAWDIDSWQPDKAHEYTREWAARTFGEDFADEIYDIKMEYYRLGIAAKPEHVQLCHFDFSNQQIDERIEQYQRIYDRTVALRSRIPTSLRYAYYQLLEYPVLTCADQNIKLLRASQSMVYAHVGQEKLAMEYARQAQEAFDEIVSMTAKYNTGISAGKWNGMMDYKPNNWSQHLMPQVASASDVSPVESTLAEPQAAIIPGDAFTSSSTSVVGIRGLGVAGASATVWPLDMNAYASTSQAPYAEYSVPVRKGLNVIQARCLPTFPINSTYDLRAAISVDGGTASTISIKVGAMTSVWDETVAQGYYPASVHYVSDRDKEVPVRIHFMDPGLTVSAVAGIPFSTSEGDLTASLLVNPDFEYNSAGALNKPGVTTRGYPKGWRSSGTLKGNSWGVNQDAKHIYGINTFWAASSPMPTNYEFYQTIPASGIEPGTYLVTCNLGVFNDKMATCRLFANKNVQYYGSEADYLPSMLTAGESNTFAGHSPSGSSRMTLKPMQVIVDVAEGESLKVGIRSSNYKPDGTRSTTDNHGWFKVDHFRIQKIDADVEDGLGKAPSQWQADGTFYDLQGRRLYRTPSRKGIYITDGHKVAF